MTKSLSTLFNALGDTNRMKIFKILLNQKPQEFCVSDIAQKLKTSIPAASKQLKAMEEAGLVKRKREGQMICYEVESNDPVIKDLIKIIKKVDK